MANKTNEPESVPENTDNPFDPANLRLQQNFNASISVKQHHTTIPVRKPGKQDFNRVHPGSDHYLQTALLVFREESEFFLVDPALWENLSGELIPMVLYLTINRQGVIRLWPIRLPDENGKLDNWNQSALEAAEIAKKAWVRVSSNRSAGMYETFVATGDLADPEWPDIPFSEILEIAFRGKYIKDWNHPALRKLRGED